MNTAFCKIICTKRAVHGKAFQLKTAVKNPVSKTCLLLSPKLPKTSFVIRTPKCQSLTQCLLAKRTLKITTKTRSKPLSKTSSKTLSKTLSHELPILKINLFPARAVAARLDPRRVSIAANFSFDVSASSSVFPKNLVRFLQRPLKSYLSHFANVVNR